MKKKGYIFLSILLLFFGCKSKESNSNNNSNLLLEYNKIALAQIGVKLEHFKDIAMESPSKYVNEEYLDSLNKVYKIIDYSNDLLKDYSITEEKQIAKAYKNEMDSVFYLLGVKEPFISREVKKNVINYLNKEDVKTDSLIYTHGNFILAYSGMIDYLMEYSYCSYKHVNELKPIIIDNGNRIKLGTIYSAKIFSAINHMDVIPGVYLYDMDSDSISHEGHFPYDLEDFSRTITYKPLHKGKQKIRGQYTYKLCGRDIIVPFEKEIIVE